MFYMVDLNQSKHYYLLLKIADYIPCKVKAVKSLLVQLILALFKRPMTVTLATVTCALKSACEVNIKTKKNLYL